MNLRNLKPVITQLSGLHLQSSHRARLRIVEELLSKAANDKIRRMRQAQLTNAEADYQRRFKEIEQAQFSATITAQPVGFGVLIAE
jgi:ATP-dependent helicase HepA